MAFADAELLGVHVPGPGAGEGVQHEPHHSEALAGESRILTTEKTKQNTAFH